jgi:hypothetical protein
VPPYINLILTKDKVNPVSPKRTGNMLGKKVLAVIFAVAVLLKLFFIIVSPVKWVGLMEVFLGHATLVWAVYLVLIIITGCYVFLSIDLLDLAVVMLFTSLLVGLSLIPYSATLLKLGGEIATVGLGQAWPALVIWVALAVAVLYRVFTPQK